MARSLLDDVLLCPNLPSLPAVAMEILELTDDPDVPIKKIAEVVQRDQALAGKVLKTVNSSFYGLSKPCASIDRAMAFLGMNTVKSLVLGFSLVDATKFAKGTGFDLMAHWRHSIVAATSARLLAERTRMVDADEAFTAGLFQDIGVLACFAAMGERYNMVVGPEPHGRWPAVEREAFGFDHMDIGVALAKKWKLPEAIGFGIQGHHNPDKVPAERREIAQIVAIASHIAEALGDPRVPQAAKEAKRLCNKWFNKRAPDMELLLGEVAEAAKTLAKMFDQDIGGLEDPARLLAEAQEKSLEHHLEVQRQAESFQKEANTDGLTGLANRKRFDEELASAQRRFEQSGDPVAVIFTDADRFKSVNDSYGHAAGDAVLMELARRISIRIGDDGVVCRYGGEEIAVIMPGTGIDKAAIAGEAVRECIAASPFDLSCVDGAPDKLDVTVSVGVAATDGDVPERYQDFKTLLGDADACVYDAKRAGRNRVFVHRPSQERPAAEAPAPRVDGKTPGLRIMLVEDDPLAATLITTLLKRKQEVHIQWIESGTRAKSELAQMDTGAVPPADVFLVDLNLPGVNGFELLRQVRGSKSLAGRPFFVLSGEEESRSRAESLKLGATEFIPKQQFVQNIGQWLGVIMQASAKAA